MFMTPSPFKLTFLYKIEVQLIVGLITINLQIIFFLIQVI